MKDDDVKIEAENTGQIEMFDDADNEKQINEKFVRIREDLIKCRKEKQEYMDGWQRAKADYVNLLKRIETDIKTSELRSRIKAVEFFLPVFDALERAREHGEIPDGFQAIAKQLEGAFASLGLEEISAKGEIFNPNIHDAIGQDIVEKAEMDNIVTAVLEKGWKIGEEIIRPAKVRVAQFANESLKV